MPAEVHAQASESGLGRHVARGFLWSIANGILERGLSAVSQLALAYFIDKRDFGLLALTYTVTTLTSLLQQFGIKQALIQRGATFERWATPAHWMSVTVGVVAAGLTIAAAPMAATYYGESQLAGLLVVASLGFPVAAFSAVADAKLSLEMRFRFSAKLAMLSAVLAFVLSLVFAGGFRWHAYSILLPPIIVGLIRIPIVWRASGIRIRWSICLRDWPSLFTTSSMLLAANVLLIGTYSGPVSLLGRISEDTALVGAFYFMHQLSDQSVRLLIANLSSVMLPALANLHNNPEQQAQGFSRALRGILLVGAPACALQAVLAGPIVRLVLPSKYSSSALLLSLLSIYMVGRLGWPLAENMLTAQRRQRVWLALAAGYVPVFLITCAVAITVAPKRVALQIANAKLCLGAAEACAIAMTLCFLCVLPYALVKCFEPVGAAFKRTWTALRFPLLGGATCVCCGGLLVSALPLTWSGDLAALVIAPLVILPMYYWGCRRFARDDLNDLLARLEAISPPGLRTLFAKLRNGS